MESRTEESVQNRGVWVRKRKLQDWVAPDVQYIALERSLEKMMQATLEKVVEEIKHMNKDWVLIDKIWDIAATRAFMLRVMKKEGWNMVADIRDPFEKVLIEASTSIGTKIREVYGVDLEIFKKVLS
ncbi:287_t:CDS:2, partial [Gigaspora margarita]